MICKNCGANNEDFLEYCEKCAAPLRESSAPSVAGRSFVSSPKWAKPDFNANTISESDLPSDYFSSPVTETVPVQPAPQQAPAYAPVQAPVQTSVQQSVRRSSVQQSSASTCAKCGASMAPGQRFCNSCGAQSDSSAPAAAASVASSAWSGASSQTIKYADPIDDRMFSYDYTDDMRDERPARAKSAKSSKGKSSAASSKGSSSKGGSSRGKSSARPSKPASRKKRGGLNVKLMAMILGGVVVAGLLIFGIIKLIGGGLFSGSAVTEEATIEKTVSADGNTVYNITTYAKKGSTVRFAGGSIEREEPVTGKSVTFAIPEQLWIPGEPVDPDQLAADGTLPVYPDISVINKKGESEDVTFAQPIYVPIPTIDMTVTSPNTDNFSVTSPSVQIDGLVGDTSVSVFVGDAAVPVEETGTFTYVYNLTEPGTFTLNVEARKNGYAIARRTFNIEYTAPAAGSPGGTGGAGAPANAGDAKSIYYATDDGVNVRDAAGTNGGKVGTLALGEKVYVISADSNDWYKIAYNNGVAYVSGGYIKKVSDISAYTTTPATIKGDDINIRSAASADAERVEVLSNGTAVSFIKDAGNGWSMIEYNNKILFVSSQYLQK
ncbi:MAG: SH3 domain-containing protein [Clostridia bacterium]|nr:SH3 domain-containing protein [Clostridia bacterium]